jgi:hypothetical protein
VCGGSTPGTGHPGSRRSTRQAPDRTTAIDRVVRRALAKKPGGRESSRIATFQFWTTYLMAWLDRRIDDMLSGYDTPAGLKIVEDPEAIFQEGWMLCDAGAHEQGLDRLDRAVAKGYFAADTLANARAFDALRADPRFTGLLARAEAARRRARQAFAAAGGERLLGRARGAADAVRTFARPTTCASSGPEARAPRAAA